MREDEEGEGEERGGSMWGWDGGLSMWDGEVGIAEMCSPLES